MRSYPRNSPQAAARIVALVAMADGHVSQSELDQLDAGRAHAALGLPSTEMHDVMQHLCEDLMAGGNPCWAEACQCAPHILDGVLGEVDDPALRRTVLDVGAQVAESDACVDETEAHLLATLVDRWGLQRHVLMPRAVA